MRVWEYGRMGAFTPKPPHSQTPIHRMAFFIPADFQVFADPHSSDPAGDVERVRLRDKLAWLHQQIYPEMRARRWDLHPHWAPQYLISTARISRSVPRIDFLLLRYSKAETVVKLMKKELGEDSSHPYSTALLGVRVDQRGLAVELLVSDRARADAQNLINKLERGAPEKRHLRQLFAELGGDYTLTYDRVVNREGGVILDPVLRAKCSRLVHLGTLDSTFAKFSPGAHQLRVAVDYATEDPRLEADTLPTEITYRMGQLYLLYQFLSWSPRNDYLPRANARDLKSERNQ
jgi:hypothetical protein